MPNIHDAYDPYASFGRDGGVVCESSDDDGDDDGDDDDSSDTGSLDGRKSKEPNSDSDFETSPKKGRRQAKATAERGRSSVSGRAKPTDPKWKLVKNGSEISRDHLDSFIIAYGNKKAAGRGFTGGSWKSSRGKKVRVYTCCFKGCNAKLRAEVRSSALSHQPSLPAPFLDDFAFLTQSGKRASWQLSLCRHCGYSTAPVPHPLPQPIFAVSFAGS